MPSLVRHVGSAVCSKVLPVAEWGTDQRMHPRIYMGVLGYKGICQCEAPATDRAIPLTCIPHTRPAGTAG
jgi:hypothetical protein